MSFLDMLFGGGSARMDGRSAKALVADGAQLVDVRTPEEYRAGHVAGARNIPVHELGSRLTELAKDKPVVLYCRSGARSSSAARLLGQAGFQAVHDIGPMSAWPA